MLAYGFVYMGPANQRAEAIFIEKCANVSCL